MCNCTLDSRQENGVRMKKLKLEIKSDSGSAVYFADIAVDRMEPSQTLPAKFARMLEKLLIPKKIKGKTVGIKMHFGGSIGYTTISPVFVRILVKALKNAGAKSVKAMDGNPMDGVPRGYTREVLECDVVSCFGTDGKYLYKEKIGFKTLDEALFGGEAVDCDFFIDLAHIKGHGDCGFGGALKNIGMGVVTGETRGEIHKLEGGIIYSKDKCIFCLKCVKECKNKAVRTDKTNRQVSIFFHNCTYCQHCVMICPSKALVMEDRRFEDFSEGMALVTSKFLKRFTQENILFINFLTNITVYCDCWGMSTASLVPDIGILASDDIVAIETASLDMIKTEDLLPKGLPTGRKLLEGSHLFEKIHAKDPYLMIRCLKRLHGGSEEYRITEIK